MLRLTWFVILFLLAGCSKKYLFSRVSGVVLDSETNKPIAGVSINKVKSNPRGHFVIEAETKTSVILPASGVFGTTKILEISHEDYLNRNTTLHSLSTESDVSVKVLLTKKSSINDKLHNQIKTINKLFDCNQVKWVKQNDCYERLISKTLNETQKKEVLNLVKVPRYEKYQAFASKGKVLLDNVLWDESLLEVKFDQLEKVLSIKKIER